MLEVTAQSKPDDFLSYPGSVAAAFNAVSPADMTKLGAAAFNLIRRPVPTGSGSSAPAALRIAVIGNIGDGKSTFIKALLDKIPAKTIHQKMSFSEEDQHVWHCPDLGWIRQYDCAYYQQESFNLPDYWNNVRDYGDFRVDLVEHPKYDRHDKAFDCLVFVARQNPWSTAPRKVHVVASRDFARSAGYRDFLDEAASLRADEKIGMMPPVGATAFQSLAA